MPEYLTKRFGGCRIRIYLSLLALVLYIFTKISADLYAGAMFIERAMDLNLYAAIVLLLAVAAIFTITGGLTAVIWTDFAQTIIMVIGSLVLMTLTFMKVGGYSALVAAYPYAIPETTIYSNSTKCGMPPRNYMHMIRPPNDPNYPWSGMLLGYITTSIWYFCADQVIVQRALAAKNMSHVKGGVIFAGYLKFLPLFVIVLPGMAARVLFPDTVGCADKEVCQKVCNSPQGCSNIAYPELVLKLMPEGARGLMMAVMMAALMSSLTSVFNSASTIFTLDVWRRLRHQASEMELLIVGKLFVVVLVILSVIWVPVIQNSQGTNLFDYIQAIQSFLAPPVSAVFLLAIFVKRVNEQGAFWGLMSGMLIGLIRFAWQYSYSSPACGESNLAPSMITKIHYLHFRILLFAITCLVTMVVSLLTAPIPDRYLHRLTFFDRFSQRQPDPIPESHADVYCIPALSDTRSESDAPQTEAKVANPAIPAFLLKAIRWVCGVERLTQTQQLQPASVTEAETSIEEKSNWRRLCAVNAIVLIALALFVVLFFA